MSTRTKRVLIAISMAIITVVSASPAFAAGPRPYTPHHRVPPKNMGWRASRVMISKAMSWK